MLATATTMHSNSDLLNVFDKRLKAIRSQQQPTKDNNSHQCKDTKPKHTTHNANTPMTQSGLLNNQVFYKLPYDDHNYAMSIASMLISTLSSISSGMLPYIRLWQQYVFLHFLSFEKIKANDTCMTDKCTLKEWTNIIGSDGDTRDCCLCKIVGDDETCGRLLPFDLYWVHANCLLWSHDIDKQDCVIDHIQHIIVRARNSVWVTTPTPVLAYPLAYHFERFSTFKVCKYCRKIGASITCKFKSCENCFHFLCCKLSECFISQNDEILCKEHFQHAPASVIQKQVRETA